MGWRISALPQAEKCGLSPALAEAHPTASGRAALKGIAYHARAAGETAAARDAADVLTAEERAEVDGWAVPPVPADAVREQAVGLTLEGRHAPHGTPGLLTQGHVDVAWREDAKAYVGDYKTGMMRVEDGPLSLQLAAYGFAMADLWGMEAMRLGIWYARRAEWEWSDVISLDSPAAADLWRRVQYAATAAPVAAPGPACDTCYQRGHCPERLLPVLSGDVDEALKPFVADGPPLTPARAAVGLRVVAAMRDVADRAEEHIRAAVRDGLRIEQDGKVYGPSEVAGRVTADVGALERDGATQYLRVGKSYQRWGWRRA